MRQLAIFVLLLICTAVHANVNVKVGMLHLSNTNEPLINKYTLSVAADIAFETVAKRLETGEYKNFSVSYVSTDGCCTRPVRSSGALAASLYHDHAVDSFLGPPISPDMAAVADLSAYWNLPVFSGVATSALLDDKYRFDTLTRTGPCVELMIRFMTAIFHEFGWKTCVVLRGLAAATADPSYYQGVIPNSVFEGLERNGITVIEVFANQFTKLEGALKEAASFSKGEYIFD